MIQRKDHSFWKRKNSLGPVVSSSHRMHSLRHILLVKVTEITQGSPPPKKRNLTDKILVGNWKYKEMLSNMDMDIHVPLNLDSICIKVLFEHEKLSFKSK